MAKIIECHKVNPTTSATRRPRPTENELMATRRRTARARARADARSEEQSGPSSRKESPNSRSPRLRGTLDFTTVAPTDEKAKAEQLKRHRRRQKALEQATPPPRRTSPRREEPPRLGRTYGRPAGVFSSLWTSSRRRFFLFPPAPHVLRRGEVSERCSISLVLLAERLAEQLLLPRSTKHVSRYNLRRSLHCRRSGDRSHSRHGDLVTGTPPPFRSLASLILGFGFRPRIRVHRRIYILSASRKGRRPHHDRQRQGASSSLLSRHDPVGVRRQYLSRTSERRSSIPELERPYDAGLHTTLAAFRTSGTRSNFRSAYDSDLEFVASVMQEVAEKEIGETMMERVRSIVSSLRRRPSTSSWSRAAVVLFRVRDNAWLEAIVRYIVDPKKAGRTKTDLILASRATECRTGSRRFSRRAPRVEHPFPAAADGVGGAAPSRYRCAGSRVLLFGLGLWLS